MPKTRTLSQNNALHLACEHLAQELNNAGLDQRKVLKPSINIPWTKKAVKDQLVRPIMTAMTGKESTTELDKVGEINEIWDVLLRHLGEKFGLEYIPFPSKTKIDLRNDAIQMSQEIDYPEEELEITAF